MTDFKSVEIERELDAPIQLVWDMWTKSEHFAAWYGPEGASIPTAEMDVTEGGKRRIEMEMGPMKMVFTGQYTEINPVTRLVYTEVAIGPDGNPMGGETNVTVELEDLDGRTRMRLTHEGVPADSPGGVGWNMAIDKLVARLAE